MKLITAIIRPERLNDTLEALYHVDVRGLTISAARGHGGETETVATYRGTTVKMELTDKIRLEIGVSEPFVDQTIDAIVQAARTGDVGDGKIFVTQLQRVVRIRTGERDISAVTPAMPV
ncbi:nitrogen regulatory protein P-II [Acidobacteria bacterium Mor1]|nr:nitrogen regulatory protein P-II [Acidobacteria bacterium Mor1]